MKSTPLIVIGASAGGVDALRSLVSGLSGELAAPVLIVLHIGAHRSELPALLSSAGPLPAKHADDNELMQPGQIYIAPPDRHMVVAGPRLRLNRRPRENWARPAINPLFRSAAEHFGASVIGVILTGRLNDGTAGLYEIKRHGGVTVVQDPDDAAYPDMPRSAVAHGRPDYCPSLVEIAALLNRLVAESQHADAIVTRPHALEGGRAMKDGQEFDRPIAVTCPDCGGALRQQEVGTLIEYRCHIQHVYTAEILAEAQFEQMERIMRAAERIIHERAEYCRQMAVRASATGKEDLSWLTASRQALDRAYELRDLIEQDWIRPETTTAEA